VASLQVQSITHPELLTALLLSKLIVFICDSLKSTLPPVKLQCYIDSEVALYWICGIHKKWKPFVENRVSVVCRNVDPNLWKHCPGISNPADIYTLQESSYPGNICKPTVATRSIMAVNWSWIMCRYNFFTWNAIWM